MAQQISYLLLFELIIFTSGKLADKTDDSNRNIMDWMKALLDKREYEIVVNNHKVGALRTHRDDTAYRSPYNDNSGENSESVENLREDLIFRRLKSLRQLMDNLPSSETSPIIYDILNQLIARQDCSTLSKCRDVRFLTDMTRNENKEYANIDEVLPLNDVTKMFVNDRNYDSHPRCVGDSCGRHRNNREDNQNNESDENEMSNNLRCQGNRCNTNVLDSNRSIKDFLRCIGNRCSINNEYNNLRILKDSGLCFGNSCLRNRDKLRCSGDSCGRSRVKGVNLRCIGGECRVRDHNDNLPCTGDGCGKPTIGDNRDDSYTLICKGDMCTINRIDSDIDNLNTLRCSGSNCVSNILWTLPNHKGKGNLNALRCFGDRCSRKRENYNKNRRLQ